MQISVFGLDFAGAVAAGCLASQGHEVIAVDPDTARVELVRRALAPVNEPGLGALIRDAVEAGRLRASADIAQPIADTSLTIICAGMTDQQGRHDLSLTLSLCEAIGGALRGKPKFHAIALRSALRPGTVRDFVVPALEQASGKRAGADFGIGICPQFLRPGSAIDDYLNPPAIILGVTDDETLARLREMDIALQAPEMVVALEEAEAMMDAKSGLPLPLPSSPSATARAALVLASDPLCSR